MNNKKQTNFSNGQDAVLKPEKRGFLMVIKIILILIIVLFVLGAVWAIPQISKAKSIYQYALSGKQSLDMAQAYINQRDFTSASESFEDAKNDFEKAKSSLDSIYFPKFLYNTTVGKQYVAADNLLITGLSLSDAFSKISRFIDDLYKTLGVEDLSFSKLTVEQKRDILDKLFQSKLILNEVKDDLDIAVESLDKIPEKGLVKPLADVVLPLKENIPQIQKLTSAILPIADILPQLTGYPEQRTYLFLLQNNDELRPSGGFVGTYGIIKVKDAEIAYFNTDDVYNLDFQAQDNLQILAPNPIQRYMNQKYWFMRDANWSPDFPTSARKIEWFYHLEGGTQEKIDGVIAITPDFIQSLMGLVGDITVQGITFRADFLTEDLEYQVEQAYVQQGIPSTKRKVIIGDLADELMNRLFDLPVTKWFELENIIETALNEKHLLIFDKDAGVRNILKSHNWTGEIREGEGDYLMVADANLASLKTDSVVDREIDYELNQNKDDELIAKVSITYHNRGEFSWRTTRLRTYTRIYVPLGSELIKGEGMVAEESSSSFGSVDVGQDLNKTYFGAFIVIEPGDSKTLSFEYKLPSYIQDQIKSDNYSLLVQKQSGTTGHDLKVGLNFNKDITSYEPTGFGSNKVDDDSITFDFDLRLDREFEINFK